jgi:DNA-directed RNA polymerase sigma subunit (sigma70/sigma32)
VASRVRHNNPKPTAGASPADEEAAALDVLIGQARGTRPLAPGDLETLLERAALGDRLSEDRLVAVNLDMVIHLATARAGEVLSISDLVQEGSIGLLEAVRLFAGSGETDFARFAGAKVGAQMEAAIAAEAACVRDAELLVAAATDYERTEQAMRHDLHRQPTELELAEKLEWTVERTRYISQVVAEARRRHDEELIAFIDPEAIDFDAQDDDDERSQI